MNWQHNSIITPQLFSCKSATTTTKNPQKQLAALSLRWGWTKKITPVWALSVSMNKCVYVTIVREASQIFLFVYKPIKWLNWSENFYAVGDKRKEGVVSLSALSELCPNCIMLSGGGFFLACQDFWRMSNHSLLALRFGFALFVCF